MSFQFYQKERNRQQYEDYYNEGNDFVRFANADRSFTRSLSKKYNIMAPMSLLDVPCGTGKFSGFFKELGIKIVGVDHSSAAVKIAEQQVPPPAKFMVGDAFELPFSERFDVIFCHGFSPFNEPELTKLHPFMDQIIARHLKEEGIFVFGKTSSLTDRMSKNASRMDHSLSTFTDFFNDVSGVRLVGAFATVPHAFVALKEFAFARPITQLSIAFSNAFNVPLRVYIVLRKEA